MILNGLPWKRIEVILSFLRLHPSAASLVAQTIKHLSTVREGRVRSLGQEDPLEKDTAIHSGTIA